VAGQVTSLLEAADAVWRTMTAPRLAATPAPVGAEVRATVTQGDAQEIGVGYHDLLLLGIP